MVSPSLNVQQEIHHRVTEATEKTEEMKNEERTKK
jgi:hypothetical protein